MIDSKRKTYLDCLRVVAFLAVVFLHVSSSNWSNVDVNGVTWQAFNFYDGITRWCVPAFAMISGALFLNRDIPISKIYTKYIPRLLAAFIVWSLFYGIFALDTLDYGLIPGMKAYIGDITTGYFHLWFVKMMIGFLSGFLT